MRLVVLVALVLLALAACQTTDVEPEQSPETDVPQVPETPPELPTFCGDGIVQSPNDDAVMEACDDGSRNGEPCNAPYGGSCSYCTSECTTERVEGGYCGDGTCQDYETNALCPQDCERVFEAPDGEDGLLYYLPNAELDGEGLVLDEQPDIADTFTIAMWLYRDEQTKAYLLSRSDEGPTPRGAYSLFVDRAGFLQYETQSLSEATSALNDVPVQEWTHIAVTYDRTSIPQLVFTINGEAGRVQNGITPPRPLDAGLLIGRRGPEPTFGFDGTIRDLRIYDRVLTTDELAALSDAQP